MIFPRITVLILNWNGLKDTIECLHSVIKIDYPNYEIIVIDNGSSDGSPKEIKKLFPEVILLENKENLGYAEGNNVGIRYALDKESDYILLLNNDTIVDPQILRVFVEAAAKYPEAGIFGGKIYYYSERNRIWYAGGMWDRKYLGVVHVGIRESDVDDRYSAVSEVDYITGCALFFRKEIPYAIGLFDPRFFLMFEETDWCFRARKAGYKSFFIPEAKLWHKTSTSFGGEFSPLYEYYFRRNLLLWAQKNLPFSEQVHVYMKELKQFSPLSLRRIINQNFLENIRHPTLFLVRIIGVMDFILRRFGSCPKIIYKLNDNF